MKHRLTFTDEEIRVLVDRLGVLNPSDYDLHTFTLLRNLYGRFWSIYVRQMPSKK